MLLCGLVRLTSSRIHVDVDLEKFLRCIEKGKYSVVHVTDHGLRKNASFMLENMMTYLRNCVPQLSKTLIILWQTFFSPLLSQGNDEIHYNIAHIALTF